MLGGAIHKPAEKEPVLVHFNEEVVCQENGIVPLPKDHLTGKELTPKATKTHPIRLINLTTGSRTQIKVPEGSEEVELTGDKAIHFKNDSLITADTAEGDRVRIFWVEEVASEDAAVEAIEVTISPETFPGTYKVVGDTFMRAEETGKDEPFQFVINKAKVQSNVTLTLQAEGDPATFEMTLNVLRAVNERGEKEMMKLVRYNLSNENSGTAGDDDGSVKNSGD